ncbi:IS110 family transposase [Chroococcidiopsis sp. CCMEE 29]|uniref:IS110 family transposase n=1 Tax=Chroococcidiopsis sp. CCMEE 29 TaxID=155894 RepID=UPI00202036C9|nr:IS110 family transposase [Chroococcidiopsis sp. CCMEE 29]
METAVLGIDVGKSKVHVCLLLPNGKSKPKALGNNLEGYQELLNWLSRQGITKVHACMEATGSYGSALARYFYEQEQTVSLVNPSRVKGFAISEMTRTKTDKVDAGVIARFCAALHPPSWSPPAAEIEQLQAIMRRLESLNQMLQQEKNRLDVTDNPDVQASISSHIQFLENELGKTRQLIHTHFKQHTNLRAQRDLLTSIPGVGEQTAASILAEIGSVTTFESARQLAAYSGLTPRERTSGTSVRGKTSLSRIGNSRLRKALFMPALTAAQCNPILHDLWERLLRRGKTKMVAVGAVMRKLLHLAFGVLKSGKPFDPDYGKPLATVAA